MMKKTATRHVGLAAGKKAKHAERVTRRHKTESDCLDCRLWKGLNRDARARASTLPLFYGNHLYADNLEAAPRNMDETVAGSRQQNVISAHLCHIFLEKKSHEVAIFS